MNARPPCWPDGTTPNACADALYWRTIHNTGPLHGPWQGWRLAGRYLVSPDGERITPERLRGLLWRQDAEARRDSAAARRRRERERSAQQLVKVVVVSLSDVRHDGKTVA